MKKIFLSLALLSASVMSYAAPTAAAPTPTVPAGQVMAVYSDAYTPKSTWGYCEGWGQTTTLEQIKIGEDNVLSYSNFNYLGWAAGTPYNCLTMEKLHLDIWADAAGKIGIVPIYGGAGLTTDDTHRKIVDLEAGKWNSFDLDLATDFAGLNLSSIFQFKYDEGTVSTFAIDNVYFYRTQAMEDDEKPTEFAAAKVSEAFFSVTIAVSAKDNSGSVEYAIMNGESKVGVGAGASGDTVTITVVDLEPNKEYSFSAIAKDGNGNAAEPIAVAAKTLALPAAAVAPTLAAENVVSLFSDVYEKAATYETLNQSWWAGPSMATVEIATGDTALYYFGFSGGSAFGWAFNDSVDATGFQKLHMDIYPTATLTLEIWPVIQPEADYHKTIADLEANKWNEVELDFTDKNFAGFKQFGWITKNEVDGFFVDNVYFYKDAEEGIEDVEAGVKAVKVVENGQLFIIKNGVKYNALGAEVK